MESGTFHSFRLISPLCLMMARILNRSVWVPAGCWRNFGKHTLTVLIYQAKSKFDKRFQGS
jgi:hypothetical protein